jgi:hypothetical protein
MAPEEDRAGLLNVSNVVIVRGVCSSNGSMEVCGPARFLRNRRPIWEVCHRMAADAKRFFGFHRPNCNALRYRRDAK